MEHKEPSAGELLAEERTVRMIVDKESLWSAGCEEEQRGAVRRANCVFLLRETFGGSLPCKEASSWSMCLDRHSQS